VHGGTLIDATGQPPIENAVITIEGDRIKSVESRPGRVSAVPGATFINAKGATILPGLLDGHGHYEDFAGEMYLHLGVTSCPDIEIFRDDYWSMAQRDGIRMGKIRGPRIWSAGRGLGSRPPEYAPPGGRAFRGNVPFSTAEEGKEIVRRKKEIGLDIIKLNEFLTPELVRAVTDEAHRLGMPVMAHTFDVLVAAAAGVSGVEHHWSVGLTSISDFERRKKLTMDRLTGRVGQEEFPFFYQNENFDGIIQKMVEKRVSWSPTIATVFRPLSPSAKLFRQRELSIVNNRNASYLPPVVRAFAMGQYEKYEKFSSDEMRRIKAGYAKIEDFMRRFVNAGGLIRAGSDPSWGMPAIGIHEEMKMFVEAGLTPMQAIQAASINVAKTFGKDGDLGTVEPGKLADLVLINGDPLEDIWATQEVKLVLINGKVIDHRFHADYKNPIPSPDPWKVIPRTLELFPPSIPQGTGPTVLKIKADRLQPYHRVTLDGKELKTHYISKSEITATVSREAVKRAGVYKVKVVSPGEFGGESYPAHLIVPFSH
jgi:imidazolonepropionase-like amidohydrolase